MRILFDSRLSQFKTPFGTLKPEESCRIHIQIPVSCRTVRTELHLLREDGALLRIVFLEKQSETPLYETWSGKFSVREPGLYFYEFNITTENESFRLLKQGNDTNMEAGERWQLSVIAQDHAVPDWAKGAVMYQIFPDRFAAAGKCDTGEKLQPFWVHESWNERPVWLPDVQGEILNNDFFGGNLAGIREKLDYLQQLGAEVLYLNPIFMAFSSHRYDTYDFKRIDPMLGTEEDFRTLCDEAHAHGMKIILDGVFSHVGSRSPYFQSAIKDKNSPYYSWFQFEHWPDKYLCWWDFLTLPCIDKNNENYANFIIGDEDSVAARWLKLGADGWRLDVVDELPDSFVAKLKRRIREVKPDALLIGEVWEDASNKIAYDVRRRYFVDNELDSVMNYPWQKAILRYVRREDGGEALGECIMALAENYPPDVLNCVMNILSTHDTARALTTLVDPTDGEREDLAHRTMTLDQLESGKELLRLAAVLQFCLPGMACIYYGDEAGMAGYRDPFNREGYIWGREDQRLITFYRALAAVKKENPALRFGTVTVLEAGNGRILFRRQYENQTVVVCCNCSDTVWSLPHRGRLLLGGRLQEYTADTITVGPNGFCIVEK